jgi:hypothetical protein
MTSGMEDEEKWRKNLQKKYSMSSSKLSASSDCEKTTYLINPHLKPHP